MIAGLSCISGHGLWLLCDPAATRVVATQAWTDTESTGLSVGMSRHFELLLQGAKLPPSALTALYGVTGPGSFTGLRMSSAFLQGLAQGLSMHPARAPHATASVPVRSVPTFDLVGNPFFIPLRPQKARELDLAQSLAQGLEFLRIDGTDSFEVATPGARDTVLGLRGGELWPTAEQLFAGIRRNLPGAGAPPDGLRVVYGLEPKISGKRQA